MPTTVESLVSRVQVRPFRTFEQLFSSEYPRVVAIAYRVLGDARDAEDIAQEVFYSYYCRHTADAPYASAWLHAATVHMALNVIRSRKRREARETADYVTTERLQQSRELGLDPQQEVERREQEAAVRAWMRRLPERQASALMLRYSGLSYVEISQALGMPVDQVGTTLRRAETALRKEVTRETSR
ncbi:MAG: sigma-70 family RNA polymerase sigma factor [Chloroflexi bacterium]|nr:sigma-70 family RNA polymerase sigma factor [Chloroflexota bacterium]